MALVVATGAKKDMPVGADDPVIYRGSGKFEGVGANGTGADHRKQNDCELLFHHHHHCL